MSTTIRGVPAGRGARRAPEVQGVTTAAAPRSADRDARMRVYVIQMSVRTACFIAALFTHGWLQLIFIAGAVILPYVAVVRVNNTGPRTGGTRRDAPAAPSTAPALPAEPETRPAEPVVVSGEVVDEPGAPRSLTAGPGRPAAEGRR